MYLCSGSYTVSHDEICYASKNCPLCEALDELAEKDAENIILDAKVQEYKDLSEEYYELLDEYAPQALI